MYNCFLKKCIITILLFGQIVLTFYVNDLKEDDVKKMGGLKPPI